MNYGYDNKDNCINDLYLARKTFTEIQTTREQYDQMEKALLLMLAHCPDEIEYMVRATITESTIRRSFYELRIWS